MTELNKDELLLFRLIYKKHFGVELSDEEAREKADKFINVTEKLVEKIEEAEADQKLTPTEEDIVKELMVLAEKTAK